MQKQQIIDNLISNLKDSTAVILTNYQGLKVDELTSLRRTLRQTFAKYQVIKNSAMSIALKTKGLEGLSKLLNSPTGIAFIKSKDPLIPVKELVQFSKEHDKLKIKSGYLFDRIFSAEEIIKIADLPPKEVLIGQLVSILKLPLMRLVNVLQSPQRNLVSVLEQIKSRKA
ncbi:MAG: 50S ribosomal protein L10 [Elusimicrobiota bacterium]|nr:50S ribosomal protein L10 [Elusimicrobiota bacterium]